MKPDAYQLHPDTATYGWTVWEIWGDRRKPVTRFEPVRGPQAQAHAEHLAEQAGVECIIHQICRGCGTVTDDYMVHDAVWAEAWGDRTRHGHLCIPCLEVMLRRPLTLDDFTPAPINNAIRWAAERLGGGA